MKADPTEFVNDLNLYQSRFDSQKIYNLLDELRHVMFHSSSYGPIPQGTFACAGDGNGGFLSLMSMPNGSAILVYSEFNAETHGLEELEKLTIPGPHQGQETASVGSHHHGV